MPVIAVIALGRLHRCAEAGPIRPYGQLVGVSARAVTAPLVCSPVAQRVKGALRSRLRPVPLRGLRPCRVP